jgi:hypothetical protein
LRDIVVGLSRQLVKFVEADGLLWASQGYAGHGVGTSRALAALARDVIPTESAV